MKLFTFIATNYVRSKCLQAGSSCREIPCDTITIKAGVHTLRRKADLLVMKQLIYLDNAATTRVLPEVAEAAVHAMCEGFGNPSSLHKMGIEASHLLEDSRKTVASALGCLPEETYFTSCGTESTNISLRGAAHLNRHKKGRIITTEIEHAATLNTCKQLAAEGFDVVFLARTRPAISRPRR